MSSTHNNKKTETRIIHTGFPTIAEQITGNYFGWNKVKKGTRWFYILGLIIALSGVLFSCVTAIYLLASSLTTQ